MISKHCGQLLATATDNQFFVRKRCIVCGATFRQNKRRPEVKEERDVKQLRGCFYIVPPIVWTKLFDAMIFAKRRQGVIEMNYTTFTWIKDFAIRLEDSAEYDFPKKLYEDGAVPLYLQGVPIIIHNSLENGMLEIYVKDQGE